MPTIKELSIKDNNNNNMRPFPRARALSSKENRPSFETGETSFRVYYGATGAAVPFMWESQPGTPKHPIFNDRNDLLVPPLTPPPSYSLTPPREDFSSRKARKIKVFRAFLSSITRRSRSHVTPTSSLSSSTNNSYSSPLSWSSSSTSSSSSRSSPRKKSSKSHRRSFSFCTSSSANFNSSFHVEDEDEHQNVEYGASTMCFGFKAQQRY